MSPEKDKKFTEDFVRKWSRTADERKKKQISKNERILKNQEEILKKDPRNHKIWFARGSLLVEMARYEEAIRCFDAVIKLDPKNKAVYNAKASALMRMGNMDEAAEWYSKALVATSEDVDRALTEILSEEAPVDEILRQMVEESREWEVEVETRDCPICGATVRKDTKICPSCDWEFYDEELEPKAFAEEEVKPERELTEEEVREKLIEKVDTFRMQGFEVTPLVRTIRTEPHRARSAVEQFEENIEKVKEYRSKLEGMDTTGFESRIKELEILFRSPYNIFVIRGEFEKLVSRIEARRAKRARRPEPERKPPAVGLTNGRRGRVNGLAKDRKTIGLTNGRTGRVNGLVNGRGRVNGITNGLGMVNGVTNGMGRVNGITNGLAYRFQTMKTGLVNGLTNGNGITNGLGSIRFRNESKMRRWKVAIIPIIAFALLTLPFLFVSEDPISDITIDGNFGDWGMAPMIPSEPNAVDGNIDILNQAAWRNHRFISLYLEVGNIALYGNPVTSSPDTVHALLDVDNDIETGYMADGIGADYMARIRGYGGNVISSQLLRYSSESDQVNWSSWRQAGNVEAAAGLKSLEARIPLSSLEPVGPRIGVLFQMQRFDNTYDFSDYVITGQGGVLEIDQRWSDSIRTISGASNRILDIYARAIERDVYLNSLTVHLTGSADASEVSLLRLSIDGLDIATIDDLQGVKEQTFQFSSRRVAKDSTAVLSVDATVVGGSGNTLAARVSSSGDFGIATGIASLETMIPTGYMPYVGSYPSQVEIDGGFHEWTTYDTDPLDQTNPNIDIRNYESMRNNVTQFFVNTYFYLDVAGVMAGGSLVPYTSPGPVKEQVYVPDSDRDTVPDSVDPYDYDFNNNQIEDSQTNFDVDEDLVQDYPRGTDCVLETILQDFFPDPYKGREVRVDICPEGPGRLTGEDYINIFIDIDGAVGGYSVGPIFADYLLQITGINSLITSREFLQFDGGQDPFAWEWIPTGSAPEAELDTERLEARAEITGRQLDMFEVVIQASDWKDNLDETDVARRGRSITRGSFGDFDTRFKSMSYESFFSDEADKVSFRRRNSYLTWSLPEEIQWVDGTDSMVLGTLNPSPLAIDDNGAVYADAYSGLDVSIEYLFETNRLKENIVLDESFQDISRNGQLSFRSHLEYSNSLMIYAEGEETDGWTQVEGGLTFHERNSRRFHVMSPYSVDSQGDVLDCHYLYEAEERLLDIRCDSNWFLTASYPVILDPTVSVYTLENDGTLGQAGEKFGHSVAIGDFNNDGYADVLTGAPYATVSSVSNAGAAYVYYGPFSGDDTSPDVYIEGSTTDAYLGWAVTSGLFNDDDYWDAVVSQKDNDVYAYYGSSSWSGQENTPDVTFDESSITDDSGEEGFGMSLHACNFDYDGTSLNFDDLLIGAPFKNIGTGQPGGNYDGGVYAFVSVFAGTETGEDHLLRPEDNKDKGQFGFSIGCGKIDSDSKWDVVVGEPWNTTLDGSVQIFYGDEINAVTETPNEWLENEVADERFGFSVAVGDMDTDSYADILVGAPYSDEGGADIGRAYVYQAETDGSGLLAQSAPDLDIAGWAAGSLFGFNVSIGDFYGDGQGDAIIAAPYNDSTNVYGSIFVFDDPIGGDAVVDDAVSGDQASEHFGWDVACGQFSNDVNLVVAGGSPDWDDGSPSETDAGRVMVFMIPENLEMVLIIAILLAIPIAVRGKKRKSF